MITIKISIGISTKASLVNRKVYHSNINKSHYRINLSLNMNNENTSDSIIKDSTTTTTTTSNNINNICDKRIIFIRHGITEMNEKLLELPWYSKKFVDAGLYDTKLSSKGIIATKEIHQQLINNGETIYKLSDVKLLLVSPLTRALQTAEILFYDKKPLLSSNVPKISIPLLRERLYLSSEVGKYRDELEIHYPTWDFTSLTYKKKWWYSYKDSITVDSLPYKEWRPEGKYCIEGEPRDIFLSRMFELKEYIISRSEDCIVIVTHWAVLKALTGLEFKNCEIKVIFQSEILETPLVDNY